MAGEDQERFEDYLELERYIEDLQAGRVAQTPEGLTPDQARVYRMATLFHAASTGDAAPRPEFVAELQAKLDSELQNARKRRPFFSKRPQTQTAPRVSRRALLASGAAAAVAAATLMGAGVDHVVEEKNFAAVETAKSNWSEDLVPKNIPSKWLAVTTLDKLGDQPVRFTSDAIVGYVIRNDGDSGEPATIKVIAVSAACTHMGCIVQWQSTDKKFHCPCHGGVFSEYGKTDNITSAVLYLSPLPRLETNVDADGSVWVRVPTPTNA